MASLEAQKREVADLLVAQGIKQGSRSRRLKSINPQRPHDILANMSAAKQTQEGIQEEKRLRDASNTQLVTPSDDGMKKRPKEKSLFYQKRNGDQSSVDPRRQIKKYSSIVEEMEQTGKGENKFSVDHLLEHDPLSGNLHQVFLKIIETFRFEQATNSSQRIRQPSR